MSPSVSLVAATDDDRSFIFDTYSSVMRPYVEWAWGWDEAFQRNGFWKAHRIADFRLIRVDGKPAGGLCIRQEKGERTLQMLILRPEHQSKGIGGTLVQREIDSARLAGEPLKLWVVQVNPARRLYERLGFSTMEAVNRLYLMRIT